MQKKILIKNKDVFTKIIVENNSIKKYLKKYISVNKKIFCICDTRFKKKFYKFDKSKKIIFIYVKGSEELKNFNNYKILLEKLIEKKIDRNSLLVGIGGGTVGDISGFVASTILRGIKFILIPTTLLSQVDSSIGGKNGINSNYGKNLVGTFYHPSEVIIDTSILKSLSLRELKAGYSEIVKHSLIKNEKFFKWLEKNYIHILNLNIDIIEKAILKSILIKSWFIMKDPNENLTNSNSRAMLNFGHSIGHSLEAFYKYNKKLNHGEAISIGMITECKIANKLGYLSNDDLDRILTHFKKVRLKTDDENTSNDKIFKILKNDKKNSNNFINIVLLKSIGSPFFKRNITIERIQKLVKQL